MKKITRVKDIYPKPFLKNIILDLYNEDKTLFPENLEENECKAMGIEYCYNHAYSLPLSPMIVAMLNDYIIDDSSQYVYANGIRITWDDFISSADFKNIYLIIKLRYKDKWHKMSAALNKQYEILNPYHTDVTDEITADTMDSNTTNSTSNHKYTTDSGVVPFNITPTTKTDDKGHTVVVQPEPIPTDRDCTDLNYTDTSKYNRTGSSNRKLTRSGNIGNFSNQKLLEEEWNFRKRQLWNEIFNDIDEVLVCNLY